jgi:hypothetical protein
MKNLAQLFKQSGTAKFKLRYDIAYKLMCWHLPPKPRILELGILHGESLKLWRAWFPDAYIVGVDINPECVQYASLTNRIFIGDQSDQQLLARIINETGGRFDLVIDDASHIPWQQVASFNTLWPQAVAPWGVYVVEDCGSNVGKFKARAGDTNIVTLLQDKAVSNMFRHVRKPAPEFICFCGQAIFIIKVPKCNDTLEV